MRNTGDETLRNLERQAATGDARARRTLRRERLRRDIHDPLRDQTTGRLQTAKRLSVLRFIAAILSDISTDYGIPLEEAAANVGRQIQDRGPQSVFGNLSLGDRPGRAAARLSRDAAYESVADAVRLLHVGGFGPGWPSLCFCGLGEGGELVRDSHCHVHGRANPDEDLRALEREAVSGDELAAQRLVAALDRALRPAAEAGDRDAAARIAAAYEQAGILPRDSAAVLMRFYGMIKKPSIRLRRSRDRRRTTAPNQFTPIGAWTGHDQRRFSIAAALALSLHHGRALGWNVDFSQDYDNRVIAVAISPLQEGHDFQGGLPLRMLNPTPHNLPQREFVSAELLYFSGVLQAAGVEDPLAWSRTLGLDT